MNFDSHLGGVAAVAAQLVNVATPGERQGRPYDVPSGARLAAALHTALLLGNGRAGRPSPAQAREFLAAAPALRPVFERLDRADVEGAARLVNALLDEYQPVPHLNRHDGEPWHLHFHRRAAATVPSWIASCAVALATAIGGDHADRLGVCAAPRCDRVYVDLTRNGTRRFCSTACQSRVKAAAHRARYA